MTAQKAIPPVEDRRRPWLEVTNFAIDCHFLESVESAANPEELKTRISSERFYNLCVLWDESQPSSQRPGIILEAQHRREYWERVYHMLPMLGVTLDIVRDILWSHRVRYDESRGRFSTPDSGKDPGPNSFGPELMISREMSDYPDFQPFRYAYHIISRAMMFYTTLRREAKEGEFCFAIKFKVIPETDGQEQDRAINLQQYVRFRS